MTIHYRQQSELKALDIVLASEFALVVWLEPKERQFYPVLRLHRKEVGFAGRGSTN